MNLLSVLFVLLLTGSSLCLTDDEGDNVDETQCPNWFKHKCSCGKTNYKFWPDPQEKVSIVSCTNSNFQESGMLSHIPNGTQVIVVNGNNFTTLDWNVFGVWNDHEDLRIIDLSNNNIKEISGKSFHKVGYVKTLVLDHNDLMVSGPHLHPRLLSNFYNLENLHLTNTFTETIDSRWYLGDLKEIFLASNLKKLKKLHLEQNEIWDIRNNDVDLFCNLPSLTQLYLSDNQLRRINFTLECLKDLHFIDLSFNKITYFDNATLERFDQLSPKVKIKLEGNPFKCDCNLKNFKNWLHRTDALADRKEDILCYEGVPPSNAGKSIMNIMNLDCPEATPTSSDLESSSSFTQALLVILILVGLCTIGVVLYVHRQKVRENVKPLVDSFQKSMQYRTIEKEEEVAQEVNV